MIKVVINVEAPRPNVFSVLSNFEQYREWLPGCEQSSVVSRNGTTTDTEIVIKSMKTMTLGLRFDAQPPQLLSFQMVSGKDMKAYSGSYSLLDSADGKGTVVIAELEIDAGPLAPRFMVDRMAKKAVQDTGEALKKYIRTLHFEAVAPKAVAGAGGLPKPTRQRRLKRILQVVKAGRGYRLWFLGQTFEIES